MLPHVLLELGAGYQALHAAGSFLCLTVQRACKV
jgi:hypothetical protein